MLPASPPTKIVKQTTWAVSRASGGRPSHFQTAPSPAAGLRPIRCRSKPPLFLLRRLHEQRRTIGLLYFEQKLAESRVTFRGHALAAQLQLAAVRHAITLALEL